MPYDEISGEPGTDERSPQSAMHAVYEEVCGAWANEIRKSAFPGNTLKSVLQASERATDSALREIATNKYLPVLSFDQLSPPEHYADRSRESPSPALSTDGSGQRNVLIETSKPPVCSPSSKP